MGRSALLGAALVARASRSASSCQYGSQLGTSCCGAWRAAAACKQVDDGVVHPGDNC